MSKLNGLGTSSLRRFVKDHRGEFKKQVKVPGFFASPKDIKNFLDSIQKAKTKPAVSRETPEPPNKVEPDLSAEISSVEQSKSPPIEIKPETVLKTKRVVRGKINIGNSCYINSINQILFNSKAFRTMARQELIKLEDEEDVSFNERKKIVKAHQALHQLYKTGSDQKIAKAVIDLRQVIFSSSFGSYHGFELQNINDTQSTKKYLDCIFRAYGFNHYETSDFIFEEGLPPHEEIKFRYSSIGPLFALSHDLPGKKNCQGTIRPRI